MRNWLGQTSAKKLRMTFTAASRWSMDGFSRGLLRLETPSMPRWRIIVSMKLRKTMYQFFWGDFCDWYIEWIKPDLLSADRERADRRVAKSVCGVRRGAALAASLHAVPHGRAMAPIASTARRQVHCVAIVRSGTKGPRRSIPGQRIRAGARSHRGVAEHPGGNETRLQKRKWLPSFTAPTNTSDRPSSEISMASCGWRV